MKNLVVTEEIWKEGNMYTAYCPELDVASCGTDIEDARKNLLEVIEIHLEEAAKLGTLRAFLENAGTGLFSFRFFRPILNPQAPQARFGTAPDLKRKIQN